MGCEAAETHLLGLGVRLGLYLQGIGFAVAIFRGLLWRSRAISDISLVTFIALVSSLPFFVATHTGSMYKDVT